MSVSLILCITTEGRYQQKNEKQSYLFHNIYFLNS